MRFLQMSFYGAVLILAIVLIRAVALNKLPKRTFLALWGIAVFRLLCPFSIPSVFSVYSIIGKGLAYTDSTAKELMFGGVPPTPTEITGTEYINQFSSTVAGNTGGSFEFPLLFVIWIIGVLVFSLFFLVCNIKCRREFLTALPAENGFIDAWISKHRHLRKIDVRVSDRISSPLTYGTICPVILLPKKLDLEDENKLNFILAHEYVHIRNFDSVKKLLLLITAILHWFNPLVWIMYILATRDIELCCDESVMRQFGVKTRAAYSMMLLQLEEKRSGVTALCNNFSKNAIEERIESIMKFRKPSVFALALAIMLVGGTATALATEALAATNSEATSNIFSNVEEMFSQLSATDDNVEDDGTVAVQKAYSSPFSKAEKESDSSGNDATIEWDENVDFPTQGEKTSISANSSIYYNFGVGTNKTYYEAGTKISFFIQCVNADIPVQVSLLTADKTTVISSQKVEGDEVETISFTIPEDGDYLLCVTNESASRTQEYSHMIAN